MKKDKSKKEQLQGEELLKLVELEQELQDLKKEHGMIEEEKGVKKFFSNYFEKKDLIFTDDMTHNACLVANALKSSQTQIEVMYKNSNTDYKSVLNELNNEIQKQDVYVSGYSNLGNAIVLWLTFFQ